MASNDRGGKSGTRGRTTGSAAKEGSGGRGRSGGRETGARTAGRSGRSSERQSSSSGRSNEGSGGFLAAVKARPLASAVFAAGAAGASAFLWAKRAQLTDQINELTEAVSERFASSGEDSAESYSEGEAFSGSGGGSGRKGRGKRSQSEIAEEALSLKETGRQDETLAGQSKVGAIAY